MDVQRFLQVTPLAAGALVIAALFAFVWALRWFRRGKRDFAWRFRREADQRATRLLIMSAFLIFMAALVCSSNIAMRFVLQRNETATPAIESVVIEFTESPSLTPSVTITNTASPTEPTATPQPTNTLHPSDTPNPTATPTDAPPTFTATASSTPTLPTATRERVSGEVMSSTRIPLTATPSQTDTPFPTETPQPTQTLRPPTATSVEPTATVQSTATTISTATTTPTPNPLMPTPLFSSVTPPANASMTITALDTQISSTFGPVNPSSAFAPGARRVYFFVTYSGMQPGMVWRGALLLEGGVVNRFERFWGAATSGNGYFFFGNEYGFGAGDYEIRLYFGAAQTPAASIGFRVVAP